MAATTRVSSFQEINDSKGKKVEERKKKWGYTTIFLSFICTHAVLQPPKWTEINGMGRRLSAFPKIICCGGFSTSPTLIFFAVHSFGAFN